MIRGILLAGGASRRFGSPKLLHPWEGALTLGEVAARHLVEGVGQALAVVRPGDDELARRLREAGCDLLITDRCTGGMGASLAAGIRASLDAQGWVVALADMPGIPPQLHRAVAGELERGALLAAAVDAQGRRGHPVGFSERLAGELCALEGDGGASGILERHAQDLRPVEAGAAQIHFDVDRREDAR